MNNTIYTHRYIARCLIEAVTPIAVGSGEQNIATDSTVMLDVNGMPYIPGTSIAGVVRHALEDNAQVKAFFGFKGSKNLQGKGSEIIFSEARMVGKDGKVVDGIKNDLTDSFYDYYRNLPIRQHVSINDKGTADDGGKFDEQVVYKGTRFCFEIEMVSDGMNFEDFEVVLKKLYDKTLRFGSGTRNGFGEVEIKKIKIRDFDLMNREDLQDYLKKDSSLSVDWEGKDESIDKAENESFIEYILKLSPKDFFLFGSGMGDDEVDMTPVKETVICWNGDSAEVKENNVVIPATSLKGALAHRTAFHYNKANEVFSDKMNIEAFRQHIGSNNMAVKTLFGSADDEGTRGNVIIGDIIEFKDVKYHVRHHVAIDRFTNAPINGALFQEKVAYAPKQEFQTKILVSALVKDSAILLAFKHAVDDLCNGLLPLGGGVNRGNGYFIGTCEKIEINHEN